MKLNYIRYLWLDLVVYKDVSSMLLSSWFSYHPLIYSTPSSPWLTGKSWITTSWSWMMYIYKYSFYCHQNSLYCSVSNNNITFKTKQSRRYGEIHKTWQVFEATDSNGIFFEKKQKSPFNRHGLERCVYQISGIYRFSYCKDSGGETQIHTQI